MGIKEDELIAAANAIQLEKFCPIIKSNCRSDCIFFEGSEYLNVNRNGIQVSEAKCTYKERE